MGTDCRIRAAESATCMRIHELTSDECHELLSRSTMGRLACARNNQPYIVPIQFSYDSERRCLYAFSTIGQKIAWMRENPKVCVEVDDITNKNVWTTVLVFGWYEEINRATAEADARGRADVLFDERDEWWLPAAATVGSREHPGMLVYRIRIDQVTGRRAARRNSVDPRENPPG